MGLQDVTMTHSGLLTGDDPGKPYIIVRFERSSSGSKPKKVVINDSGNMKTLPPKKDEAEIKLPSLELIMNKGFSDEECNDLKAYLREHEKELMEKAKSISSFLHIFR